MLSLVFLALLLLVSLVIPIANLGPPPLAANSYGNITIPAAEALKNSSHQSSFPCQDAAFLLTGLTIDNQDSRNTTVVAGSPITVYVYLDSVEREGDHDTQHKALWPTDNVTMVLQIIDSNNVAVAIATKEIDLADNTSNINSPQIISSITLSDGLPMPGKYTTGVFFVSSISNQGIPEVQTPVQQLVVNAIANTNADANKVASSSSSSSSSSNMTVFQMNSIKNATEQTNPPVLYDDFAGVPYTLNDGEYSPNCKWQSIYNGYGELGVRVDNNDDDDEKSGKIAQEKNKVFFEEPARATGPSVVNSDNKSTSGTHAGLALTTLHDYKNFHLAFDVKTKMQLRSGFYSPNPWETAWILFNYVDRWHGYYFILKPNGIEMGKKDNDKQLEQQIDLISRHNPKGAIGSWQHIDLVANENRILAYVNGSKVLDYTDENMNLERFGSGGAIGLYCEDAEVVFDNVYIARLPSS
jgi:Domain of Unknown Function (DUF1080)